MASQNWIPLLRKVFLFSGFPESQLQLIAKKIKLISLPKGAVVFQENDPGNTMYIVSRGTVHLTKKSETENPSTVAYLNRGDSIGEMSILVGDLYPNTAVVDSTVELLSLTKQDFDALLEHHPALAVHLSRLLSSRLATLDRTERKPGVPGKIFTFIPLIPAADQIVFFMNFSIALQEQTRRKILFLSTHRPSFLPSLGLSQRAKVLSLTDVDEGALDDSEKFSQFLTQHASGLDLLFLDDELVQSRMDRIQYELLSMVKEEYDCTVLVIPADATASCRDVLAASSRVSTVMSPQTSSNQRASLLAIKKNLPTEKKLDVLWLTSETESVPTDIQTTIRIPWDLDWGSRFQSSGDIYLPDHAKESHRALGRLARNFGQLSIGLAMGSGAAFGYSLIGILRILEKEGVYPDVISGTSMGALIGAFYASGKSPDELEAIARTITRFRLFTQLSDFTFPRSGLIRGNAVLKFLKSHLGDRSFQDLILPFSCVATDIQTGKEIILDQGNVAEAVRASLSLPFFFEPAYLDGRYLVDGGLVNPVPTSVAVAQGANILLSANLTLSAGERKVPRLMGWRKRIPKALRGPSIPEILMKTIYTMQYEISETRSGLADVVMHINAPDLLWWDLDKADGIIKLGEAAAEESMAKIKSMLPFFSDSCKINLRRS